MDNRLCYRAEAFATGAHAGQTRKYHGGPYIEHPRRVAERLEQMGASPTLVAAAYLHDVVEDGGITVEHLACEFGPNVARIVAEVTNPPKAERRHLNRAARKAEDRERLSRASREAKLLKLVDRIDNLNEMGSADREFALMYADESELLAGVIGDADEALKHELLLSIRRLQCEAALQEKETA